ncbi:MAG: glycosyltransferase [Candidatus Micrarchaeota archaeon]|nr:glycosyltransferase [Candidatus Micrarchaeota archaeon]
MESLNIAFYTDSFLPAKDGVVTSILNFRQELERRGHNVYIFASGERRITSRKDNVFIIKGVKFKKYPQYNLAIFPFFSSVYIRDVKLDVAHVQTPFTMGLYGLMHAKMNKIPVAGSFHTHFSNKSVIQEYTSDNKTISKFMIKYAWKYARFFYRKCDEVIAPSESTKEILIKKHIKNVTVVPNSVDLKKFNPQVSGTAMRNRLLKSRKNDRMVLYMGRLSKEKKVDIMIKAAKLLKNEDITFVIGGTGPAAEYYQNMVNRMHLNNKIKFIGFVPQEKLPQLYAASDLLCMPSTFETQGVVAVEAMATGKPVVAANYLALKELVVNGRNGEKFKANDPAGCARKIERVIYNLDSYKGMFNTAKRYSIERTTDDLLNVYRRIINEQASYT